MSVAESHHRHLSYWFQLSLVSEIDEDFQKSSHVLPLSEFCDQITHKLYVTLGHFL